MGSELLVGIRCLKKLYEQESAWVCEKHGLSQLEVDIIAYLFNHPEQDTARDIVELRMLPKANVSQAVERMIGKGLLLREPDLHDRRRIHLKLTETARGAMADIDASRARMRAVMLSGFSTGEVRQYMRLEERIIENLRDYLR